MAFPSLPMPPRPERPVITPHPLPPISAPRPAAYYGGIGEEPFRIGVRAVEPPFAPEAFMRPAPVPGPVRIPAGLPGPIFGAPGWHVGPPVHVSGYGAAEPMKPSTKAMVGIALGVLALLALPTALTWAMSRKKTKANPKHRRNPALTAEVRKLGDRYHPANYENVGMSDVYDVAYDDARERGLSDKKARAFAAKAVRAVKLLDAELRKGGGSETGHYRAY